MLEVKGGARTKKEIFLPPGLLTLWTKFPLPLRPHDFFLERRGSPSGHKTPRGVVISRMSHEVVGHGLDQLDLVFPVREILKLRQSFLLPLALQSTHCPTHLSSQAFQPRYPQATVVRDIPKQPFRGPFKSAAAVRAGHVVA